jgi:hypothetical protein
VKAVNIGVTVDYDDRLCKGRTFPHGITDKIALAVTWNAQRRVRSNEEGIPLYVDDITQLQLCPWFVEWIRDRKYKLGKDLKRTIIGKTVIKLTESTSNKYGFAQIGTTQNGDLAFSIDDGLQMRSLFLIRFCYMR